MSGNCQERLTFGVNMSAEWFNSVTHALISQAQCRAGCLTVIAFCISSQRCMKSSPVSVTCCGRFVLPWWLAWVMPRSTEPIFGGVSHCPAGGFLTVESWTQQRVPYGSGSCQHPIFNLQFRFWLQMLLSYPSKPHVLQMTIFFLQCLKILFCLASISPL